MAKKNTNRGTKIALGAGALAMAAAAAGYYFYASKDAKKHRKIASAWAVKLKRDALRQAKTVGAISKADVMKAVSAAAAAYEGVKTIDGKELRRAAQELKDNWQEILSEMGSTAKKSVKKVKKAAKRVK